MCLFKCITGIVSGNLLAENVLTSSKTPEIFRKVLLSNFSFILGQIDLEKVTFNQIWDFRSAW